MESPDNNEKVQHNNPLMQRIQMPGETFTLPSGGIFYTNGELDSSVKNAEVRVHPMTAIDEITIKTPDMLFSGDAVREVFARCIPQIKDPDKLLAKDVDYLLVCLRKVSYGDEMQIEHKHDCENAAEHTYELNVNDFINKAKKLDPTTVTEVFSTTMPNGQQVFIQPIRYHDFIDIMQNTNLEDETSINVEKVRDMLINSMLNVIVKVDEISDRDMIREWLAGIPPSYIKKINEQFTNTFDWGPEFNTTVKCKDCGADMQIYTPMNPLSFFT